MRKILFLVVFCIAFPALVLAQAGQVVDFRVEAFITPKGAAPKAVSLKQAVQVGDLIETKATGSVKILFIDDTVLTLKENSKTIITEFLFDAKGKKRKSVFNVLVGKVRTTVGKYFGDDQTVEIRTPTAVAGIRGTDVGALVRARETSFFCFDGKFQSYNIDFPEKVVTVTEGFGLQIMEGVPASQENLAPIPSDVPEKSYDISLSTKPETKETGKESTGSSQKEFSTSGQKESFSSGQQATQSASSAAALEAAQSTSPFATADTSTSATDYAAQAQSQESSTVSGLPSDSTTSGTATLPGGATESTTTTTESTDVKLTFP